MYTEISERGFAPGFVKKPHIRQMLNDAYSIVQAEMRKLKAIAETEDRGFTDVEARRFGILSQQLTRLAEEERSQLKDDKLEEKTDEELLAMVKDAAEALEKK